MKSRDGKSQREEKSRREQMREEKESEERRCNRRAKKVGKARNTVFSDLPMICGSGESKSTLAKAAGAEPVGR